MTASEHYTGECKDCYQHVLSPECDGHGIRAGEPCPYGKSMEKQTTSEPTTGAIVLNLKNAFIHLPNWRKVIDSAISKLESHKQANDALLELLAKKDDTIAALTARAEQAERERDAAVDLTAIRIMRYIIENDVEIEEWNEPCELCEHHYSTHGKCGNCYSTENFELRKDCRGLPQDGEGK